MKSTLALFCIHALALAQPGRRLEAPAERSLVTVVHVKPDMLSTWLDLQKNAVIPALKKAGVKTRTVYSPGVLGTAYEYVLKVPMTRFAELDSTAARAQASGLTGDNRVDEKLQRCIAASRTFLSTSLPDISNPGETPNPPVVGFLRLRINPGKTEEYINLYKTEVLPLLKKADSKVFAASLRLGTDGYDLTLETPMSKFADLDAPPALIRVLGPQVVAAATAKLNPLATVMENTILVRQADLSF